MKKKNIKIIAIVAIIIALCSVLAALILFKESKNGIYVEQSYSQGDMEFYIEVDKDNFNMTLKSSADSSQTVTGKIVFGNDKVTLETATETLEGTYNKGAKSIYVAGYTFVKE